MLTALNWCTLSQVIQFNLSQPSVLYICWESPCVITNNGCNWSVIEMCIFTDMADKAFVHFPLFFKIQLAKDLLHPSPEEEKRRHKKKRLVQSPNSYFMDVKCPGTVFFHMQIYLISHRSVPSFVIVWHLSTSAREVSVKFWCQCCNWLSCLVFSRLLQDHNSFQPRSDSRAVCWLFNSPVSAHWRQSTSHRGSVLTYRIPV